MAKIELIDEAMLDSVTGGALDVRVSKSAEFGTCTSTLTGKSYRFNKADKSAVYTIVASSGSEAEKLEKLAKYWI